MNEPTQSIEAKLANLWSHQNAFADKPLNLLSEGQGASKTIADMIADKIKEKRSQLAGQLNQESPHSSLEPAVVDLYKQIGMVLSKYTSGKLPKAFKTIPALANWEQLLQLTRPERWTSAAVYEATRLFVANLKEKPAQRFMGSILLPRVRDDIAEHKKLNVHLFKALTKSLYKPGAFFKGIVLPICESTDCTQKEASIICSVIIRHHIPILHACAAMLRIAEMNYSCVCSIFLNALINKRYALPYRVIDAVVFHFIRLASAHAKDPLPSLWHRCLFSFVDFYHKDISSEQKESLDFSLSLQWHSGLSPKIRRMLRSEEHVSGSGTSSTAENGDQPQSTDDAEMDEMPIDD
jgi:essential nuclear protein 1